ncbi:MAG TPA: protein kinase [Myxococcaceae bacterium]|nr:protein kinase [Myxococcaceae bacterium]
MNPQGASVVLGRRRVGAITHVTLGGVIDETFTPEADLADLRGYVVLDLGRVSRISSFGVRNWSAFVAQPPPGAQGLFLINAPPVFVDQLNLVEGFAGASRLLSVLAPYRCRTCSADRLGFIDLAADAEQIAGGEAPPRTCAVCRGTLEFTDTPAEFFDYVRRQHPVPLDQALQRFCQWLATPNDSELSSPIKIVEGETTYLALPSHLRGNLNVRRLSGGLEGRVAFDFAFVQKIDPEAIPKLRELLEVASGSAELFLSRLSAPAAEALLSDTRSLPGRLLSLHLPQTCANCGLASLVEARPEALVVEQCQRCGGHAQTGSLELLELAGRRFQVAPEDALSLHKLTGRALSQHLFGPAIQEHGTGSIRIGESTASSGGLHRLQILRRIGQGGMAEVFLARQVGENGFEKFLVMKKILSQFAESQEFVEMLFAEARANARLTHPNIVQTFDMGTMDGAAYITMEYVRGPDLKRLLKELGRKRHPLPVQHALRIVAEIAAGLHYAHSYVDPNGLAHPVVHRDVSPHNILVSLDGAIKLSDFGIAKVQGEERTEAGVIKGKVSYLSPEAACGRPLDARNDVFSLGVVLFELLTGKRPFKRDHDAATINAIVREPAPNPSELNPSIPQDVSDVVLRALVKDPSRRTPSAGVVHEELEAVMVRHRMTSTPFAVAQFFKEVLEDKLAEFAPPNTGSNPSIRRPAPVSRTDEPASKPAPAPELGIRLPEVEGGASGSNAAPSPAVGSPDPAPAPGVESAVPPAMEARRVPPIAGGRVPLPGPGPASTAPSSRPSGAISNVPPAAGAISNVSPAAGAISNVPPAAGAISNVPPASGAISNVPPAAGAISNVPPAAGAISNVPPMATPAPAQIEAGEDEVEALLAGLKERSATGEILLPVEAQPAAGALVAAPEVSPDAPANGASTPQSASASETEPVEPQPSSEKQEQGPVVSAKAAPAKALSATRDPGSAGKTRWLSWVMMALAVFGIGGGVAFVVGKQQAGIPIHGLDAGEQLYVNGTRVNGGRIEVEPGSELFISTASGGKLARFGTVQVGESLDVRNAPQAHVAPGQFAQLHVVTGASGCKVSLSDGSVKEQDLPLRTPISAAHELEVILRCAGDEQRSWIMAVPNQAVELSLDPS